MWKCRKCKGPQVSKFLDVKNEHELIKEDYLLEVKIEVETKKRGIVLTSFHKL